MILNKISSINNKAFMAQNDNPSKRSGLQKRKIIESAGMGAGLGLFARLGGSIK